MRARETHASVVSWLFASRAAVESLRDIEEFPGNGQPSLLLPLHVCVIRFRDYQREGHAYFPEQLDTRF